MQSSLTVSAAIQVKRMDIVLGVPVGEGDGGAIVMEKLSLTADQIRKCASFHCRWVLILNCFVPKLRFFLLSSRETSFGTRRSATTCNVRPYMALLDDYFKQLLSSAALAWGA